MRESLMLDDLPTFWYHRMDGSHSLSSSMTTSVWVCYIDASCAYPDDGLPLFRQSSFRAAAGPAQQTGNQASGVETPVFSAGMTMFDLQTMRSKRNEKQKPSGRYGRVVYMK
jgi:hypothetical protein